VLPISATRDRSEGRVLSDDEHPIPFYAPHQPPAPPRQATPGALLFESSRQRPLSRATARSRRVRHRGADVHERWAV